MQNKFREDFYLKALNVIGPIAGITLVFLILFGVYLQRQPRYLPINAAFHSNNQAVKLEVAQQPQDYYHGLKFRRSLPKNTGMLFVLKEKEMIKLWMKDTYIPLDVVFLSDGVIKNIIEAVPPCKTKSCPKYDSIYPVDRIIELPAGSSKSLKLYLNQKIKFTY